MSDRGDDDDEYEGLRILGSDPDSDADDTTDADDELPHWSASPGDGGAWTGSDPEWDDSWDGGSADTRSLDDVGAGSTEGGTGDFNPSLLPPDEPESYQPEDVPIGSPYADDPGEFGAMPVVTHEPADVQEHPEAPPAGGRDLPKAIGVAVVVAGIALLAFSLGKVPSVILVAAILAAAAVEWFHNLRQRGYQPATFLGIAACALLPLATYWRGVEAIPLVMFLTMLVGGLWYLIGVSTERPVPNLGVTMYGVVYIGVLGSFAGLLLDHPNGIGMLLAAVIVTVAYDVGGFAIGSALGRSTLSVASPNKTIEGLLGGGVVAIVASVIAIDIFNLTPFGDGPGGFAEALALGVAAAIIAPVGDLTESLLKRDLDIKDMGSLLPGHGGILDRFDAMLFMLPTTYYLVRLFDLF